MEASNFKAIREALERVEKLAREFAAGNYYVSDFPKMLLDAIRPVLAEPTQTPVIRATKKEGGAK